MKLFEAALSVTAPDLRAAKRAVRDMIKFGPSAEEFVEELIDGLKEVKPPKEPRRK